MSMEQIKNRAGQIVNYAGPGAKKGYYGYNGSRDEFVHFDGANAFPGEVNTDRTFEITFDTTIDGADIEVILFPSIYP